MFVDVLGTENLGLKIEPNRNEKELWDIVCFRNSDYTGDPAMRPRMSEFVSYVLGVLFFREQRHREAWHV